MPSVASERTGQPTLDGVVAVVETDVERRPGEEGAGDGNSQLQRSLLDGRSELLLRCRRYGVRLGRRGVTRSPRARMR